MFNLRLCNAATIRHSILNVGHMHLCGKDYKYFHHTVVSVTVLAVLPQFGQFLGQKDRLHAENGGLRNGRQGQIWGGGGGGGGAKRSSRCRKCEAKPRRIPTDSQRGSASPGVMHATGPIAIASIQGFPNPRRALIGSNQLWRDNDSP